MIVFWNDLETVGLHVPRLHQLDVQAALNHTGPGNAVGSWRVHSSDEYWFDINLEADISRNRIREAGAGYLVILQV